MPYLDYEVKAVDSGLKAIEILKSQVFDLVFLDTLMPEFDGIETLKIIKSQEITSKVIMVSAIDSAQEVRDAFKLGALDYITKPFDHKTILKRVEDLLLTHNFKTELHDNSVIRLNKFSELTTRELEVMEFVAQGLSNSEIGDRLFISPKTVRNHITNIFSKLSLKTRAKAIVLAREGGFGFKNRGMGGQSKLTDGETY